LEARRVLVVTDPEAREARLVDGLLAHLQEAGAQVQVFDQGERELSLETCERGAELARQGEAQLVVGMGGAGALDAAKVISLLALDPRPARELLKGSPVPGRALPKVLCPTAPGTGSEMSPRAEVAHEIHEGRRAVMEDEALFPDGVIVDPALTLALPPSRIAALGMDALSQAVEAYVSIPGNPFSHLYAQGAIPLLAGHLRPAVLKGARRPEAGHYVALGATWAGLALVNSGGTALCALAEALRRTHGLVPGVAKGILLPAVMEWNIPADIPRYAQIARWLGVAADPSADERELAYRGAQAVRQLCVDCGIEPRMSAYGVTRDHIDGLVEAVFQEPTPHLEANPRDLDREQVRQIYEMAL